MRNKDDVQHLCMFAPTYFLECVCGLVRCLHMVTYAKVTTHVQGPCVYLSFFICYFVLFPDSFRLFYQGVQDTAVELRASGSWWRPGVKTLPEYRKGSGHASGLFSFILLKLEVTPRVFLKAQAWRGRLYLSPGLSPVV